MEMMEPLRRGALAPRGPGAWPLRDRHTLFRVWAPERKQVELKLEAPEERLVAMQRDERGYWTATVDGVGSGARYRYRLDGGDTFPDPASRFQPEGVHGPSEVVSHEFAWTDSTWSGIPLTRHVLYELHVGTFSEEGTFEAIIPHLDGLKELGVTTLEIMPVAQFPGERNWGYDGVYAYAAQSSYGGPLGLKRLVDAAHARGLAVILDVVYNHLGPEGNYLGAFAPYTTDCYKTPWGASINFDGPHSDEVRRYFAGNAVEWVEQFHIDGLRLDATHFILDTSARHFLRHLAERVRAAGERTGRRVHLFAESDANDVRWVLPTELNGLGQDAQWLDDWQHALVTLLPGADAEAYKPDYGRFDQLAKAFSDGFVYAGEYSPFRKRSHGNSSRGVPGERFVVFMQNHDQVGNRPLGDRLCQHLSFESTKLAAAATLLSPYLPLIFMGEEHADKAPFLYFVSHGDKDLIEAVRKGRNEEFSHMLAGKEPADPQDESTFLRSRLDHSLRHQEGPHKTMWEWHRELLRLRRELEPLARFSRESVEVHAYEAQRVLAIRRTADDGEAGGEGAEQALVVLCLSEQPVEVSVELPAGRWVKVLDSAEERWSGPGSTAPAMLLAEGGAHAPALALAPQSAAVYVREIPAPSDTGGGERRA